MLGLLFGKKQPKDEALSEFFRSIGLVTQVGIFMLAAIGAGFAAGYFVDKWLGTGHWFLIAGICLGVAAGFVNVYRMLLKSYVPKTRAEPRDGDTEPPK